MHGPSAFLVASADPACLCVQTPLAAPFCSQPGHTRTTLRLLTVPPCGPGMVWPASCLTPPHRQGSHSPHRPPHTVSSAPGPHTTTPPPRRLTATLGFPLTGTTQSSSRKGRHSTPRRQVPSRSGLHDQSLSVKGALTWRVHPRSSSAQQQGPSDVPAAPLSSGLCGSEPEITTERNRREIDVERNGAE